MNPEQQNITVRSTHGETHVLSLQGSITAETGASLVQNASQILQPGLKKLILDFENVDFVDCAGVCALVEVIVMAARKKTQLAAYGASRQLLTIYRLTGLHDSFQHEDHDPTMQKPAKTVEPGIGESHSPSSTGYLQNWSSRIGPLIVEGHPPNGTINLNVNERYLQGPLQGFGQLWQKRYTLHIDSPELSPEDVISHWKAHFGTFWPPGNYIYIPGNQIRLDTTGLLDLAFLPGFRLVTGMVVMYDDQDTFAFLTPQGHMYAGWISFSARKQKHGVQVQIQALIRASDPVYELGFRMGFGHKMEDRFWAKTLQNLGSQFGSSAEVVQKNRLIDPRIQWRWTKNLWYNAAIRTTLYQLFTPIRWITGRITPS